MKVNINYKGAVFHHFILLFPMAFRDMFLLQSIVNIGIKSQHWEHKKL